MVYLTFASEFNAVHTLWNPNLGDAENVKIFAECANPAGHGHRYRVETTLAADVTAQHPVVVDRKTIGEWIDSVLAPKLEHANMDTTFGIEGFISTGENVTRAIWQLIEPQVPDGVSLIAVRVIETPKNSFVYSGERLTPPLSVPMR